VEQIDVGVFSRNDCRKFDQRRVGAMPRWLILARLGAPPRVSHTQRIVMIARSADDRGVNQFITATFTLHDPVWDKPMIFEYMAQQPRGKSACGASATGSARPITPGPYMRICPYSVWLFQLREKRGDSSKGQLTRQEIASP
jgi:hypothetical protein